MDASSRPFVIVGAGLAGAKTAEGLRDAGYDGGITLIGAEEHLPYERPGLSKGFLQGTEEWDKLLVHPAEWYGDKHVELRLGTKVTAVDPHLRYVELSDGERVPYERLLLGTGSSPRRLMLPGADLAGVMYLRTVDDSRALRQAFGPGVRVVIIGAGWIGLETAAAARGAEAEVAVLEHSDTPLLHVLGSQLGQVFADLHVRHGVDLRCGVSISSLRAQADDDSKVGAVVLADGTEVPADIVIIGVGVSPNDYLGRMAGLEVDNGIVVDAQLRSSDPHVFAAGDVANMYHPWLGRRLRVEHWANALNQPAVAAKAMLGQEAEYDMLPYFYTDQYDLGMEYIGYADPEEATLIVRGDLHSEFIAFWVRDGKIAAAMNVNVWDVTDTMKELIRSRITVDPSRLAEPDVPLAELP